MVKRQCTREEKLIKDTGANEARWVAPLCSNATARKALCRKGGAPLNVGPPFNMQGGAGGREVEVASICTVYSKV